MVPVMESCPEARDLGGFNLLADKAALGGEEASLAARRSRFSFESLLLLSLLSTKKNFVLVTGCTITSLTWRRATPPRESTSCASVPQVGVGDDDDDDGSPR